jgi:transposase
MNIIETKIPDVHEENINQSKVVLADNIIRNIYPLFDEVFNTKVEQVRKLEEKLESKKVKVLESKRQLEQGIKDYKKKQKESKLLDRINRLVSSGLIYDGNLKHEMTILLKIINNLSEEKLDYHLSNTLKIIGKRFSR